MRKGLALLSLAISLISFPAFAAEICAPTTVPGPRIVLKEYDRPAANGKMEHVTEIVGWNLAPNCKWPPDSPEARLPAQSRGAHINGSLDAPIVIDGTEVACTGTGRDARHDSRWEAFPLRLAFVRGDGHYLGGETVSVTGNGVNLRVTCKGPWLLMKLPAGSYSVHAEIPNIGSHDLTVTVPATGQRRRVIRF